MNEKGQFFFEAFELHLRRGRSPRQALEEAAAYYALVYCPEQPAVPSEALRAVEEKEVPAAVEIRKLPPHEARALAMHELSRWLREGGWREQGESALRDAWLNSMHNQQRLEEAVLDIAGHLETLRVRMMGKEER